MTPEAKPEFVPILRELAAGLREGDGDAHLITFKPDPAPYSSSFIHGEPWLDFDSMQTWKSVELIYPFITKDYNLKPVKPVLMARRRLRARLGVRVRRHAALDSPAGLLLLPRRRPSHLRPQR